MAHVVIVGCNPAVAQKYADAFRAAGHEATVACDLRNVTEAVEGRRVDVAMMLHGFIPAERARAITALQRCGATIPIVALYFQTHEPLPNVSWLRVPETPEEIVDEVVARAGGEFGRASGQ